MSLPKRHHKSIEFTGLAEFSYKIGVAEVEGMRQALVDAMKPVRAALRSKAYWNETLNFEDLEYKSRDGFIAHSHNFGGIELGLIVPECESYEWDFLEFGEPEINDETGEPYENEGELDAYLRIILKFEGFNERGEMEFYINVSGGNNDAPYFRVNQLPDLFEAEFTCKTLKQIGMKARPYVKKIVKMIGGTK